MLTYIEIRNIQLGKCETSILEEDYLNFSKKNISNFPKKVLYTSNQTPTQII